MAQCATTAFAGAVTHSCVRGARGRFAGLGPVPGVVSLPFPPSSPACPALRLAGRPVQVSLTLARWYAIPRGLCVALLVVPACPLRVCALALPRRPLPPPLGGVACASRAVPALGAGRAVPRALCPSVCPAPVPCSVWRAWGGAVRSRLAPTWLGAVRPRGAGPWRSCAGGRVWGGGGGARAPCPPFVRPGGPVRAGGSSASFRPSAFPGQATKRVSLASFWSLGASSPYHSVSCSPAFSGRDLCGVLACWRGLACSPRFLWEPAAGAGARAVLRLLSRAGGGGTTPPASGGGGRRPRGLRAGRGGGGSRRGLPAPPLAGSQRFPTLAPTACAFGRGRGAPLGGRGDEGRPSDRSPGGLFRPEPPFCPTRVGNGHAGGHGGRGLHTVLVRRRAPPPGLVRAPLRRAGVGSPVGRDSRESRRQGALGRAVCRSSRIPPPASRSLLRKGGRPLGSGGAEGRSFGPQAGGGERGRGAGGAAPPPAPPRPVWRRPAISCLRRALPGYTRAVGVAGRLRASGAAKSAAKGSVRRGGGGGRGGGGRPGSRPRLPQAGLRRGRSVCAVLGAAGPPSVGSGQGGSVRAVHWGRLPRPRCPLTPGAAASFGVVPGRRLFGLPPSALGPEREGGGSWGGPLFPWRRPQTAEGGRPGGPNPGGQPSAGGSPSSPAPLYLEPDPRAGPRWGPLSPPPSPRGAGRPGAAVWVSGQRLAGCGALGSRPRSLSPPSLPRQCARFLRQGYSPCRRRAGGRGQGRGVARWGCGVRSQRVWGPLPGRGGRACCWGGRAVSLAGSGSWVDGPVSAEAAWGCPSGSPTGTAASASHRSSRSAGVSPAPSGETGERERDRRWWQSSRWGEPSESDITVILVGMRGGRCALPTTSRCISVVSWAVPCSALRGGGEGGGAAVASAQYGRGPAAIHRHWEGEQGSHAARASRHSSQSGAGLRDLGPRGLSGGAGGSRTRWTPVTAVTSCVRRRVCTPSCAAGARRGGAGYGCCPIEVGGGDPQDPFRVPAGCDDEE